MRPVAKGAEDNGQNVSDRQVEKEKEKWDAAENDEWVAWGEAATVEKSERGQSRAEAWWC